MMPVSWVPEHTGKECISYGEALEEALCFGWIDGIIKSMDDEKYVLRFSPRQHGSIWSEANKKRVARMIEQGRMTSAGLVKIEDAKRNGEWDKAARREDVSNVPADLRRALRTNKAAQRNFHSLAPSHKKQYIYWITDAKRDETRQRRIQVALRLLTENKKLGIDTRMTEKHKT
jgi:uncharacterized protein YdeI (YjbR/CyaY-like superfamily)